MSELIRRSSQVLLSTEDQVTDGSSRREDNGALRRAIAKEERSHNRLHENNTVSMSEGDAGSESQPLLPAATVAVGDRHMPVPQQSVHHQDENSRNSDSESGTKGNGGPDVDDKSSDSDCSNFDSENEQLETGMTFPLPPEEPCSTEDQEVEELRQLMRETRRDRLLCGPAASRSMGSAGLLQSSLRYIMMLVVAFLLKAIVRKMNEKEQKDR